MTIRKLDKNLAHEDWKVLTFHLLEEPLFVPDSLKGYGPLLLALKRVVDEPLSIFMGIYNDETDELVGAFGIINIVPEDDARFVFWCWDKSAVTHTMVKECRDLITYVKGTYKLYRITAQSATDWLTRFLQEFIGFKVEGRFRGGYKHGGKFHNLYQLRVIGEL